MQKTYKCAIVGGGASGLMTAVELLRGKNALSGADVLILERTDRVGKKLISTGNGQGNLSNRNFGVQFYHGEKAFIEQFINNAKAVNLEEYLKDLSIPLCTLKDGKMYPLSRQASAVLDVIRAYLKSRGCQIVTDAKVLDVSEKDGKFRLKTQNFEFFSNTVVLSTGGACAKQFGTDGTSYTLAQKFGHELTALYPSLVQLKTDTGLIRGLKGLKEVARVKAIVDGKVVAQSVGDLLFTDYGVSGNSVFQVSAYFNGKKEEYLNIEFLPDLSEKDVTVLIKQRLQCDYIDKSDLLVGILNKRIGQAVLKTAKGSSPEQIAGAIKNFKLKVYGNLGFNYSQVTKGGISTDSVDAKTYQSKLKKGLYIVGETLDVDGDCGGYNVTFAFVSGICAARSIKLLFNKGEQNG